jgi:hypothetical protein
MSNAPRSGAARRRPSLAPTCRAWQADPGRRAAPSQRDRRERECDQEQRCRAGLRHRDDRAATARRPSDVERVAQGGRSARTGERRESPTGTGSDATSRRLRRSSFSRSAAGSRSERDHDPRERDRSRTTASLKRRRVTEIGTSRALRIGPRPGAVSRSGSDREPSSPSRKVPLHSGRAALRGDRQDLKRDPSASAPRSFRTRRGSRAAARGRSCAPLRPGR